MSTRIDMCDYCDEQKEVVSHGFAGVDESEGSGTYICQDCLEHKISEYKQMLRDFDEVN